MGKRVRNFVQRTHDMNTTLIWSSLMNIKQLSLILTSSIFAFGGINAHAATSADITLTGTVDQDCSVSLDASSYTLNLVAGESDSTVANVTEVCNDADGYTIAFSSANSGVLQNDDNPGQQKNYSISYGTGSGSIDSEGLDQGRSVNYASFTAGNSVPLRLNLSAHTGGVLAAGNWSDTITVSIASL